MDIVLDEKKWITSVLESNDLGKRPVYAVMTYARYLYSIGVERDEMWKRIEELLIRCNPNVNLLRWGDKIKKAIRHSGDRGLVQIDAVCITRSEIETIKTAAGVQRQKLLFTLLCIAKYDAMAFGRTGNWVCADIGEVFKTANVTAGIDKRGLMLGDLIDAGYISKSKRPNSVNLRLNYVDNTSDVVMHIRDFRNLGNQYDNYLHGGYMECAECGLVVRKKSGRQKYCRECGMAVNTSKTIRRYRGSVA